MNTYHTIPGCTETREGSFRIIMDAWWMVNENGEPLFYGRDNCPQCNRNRHILDVRELGPGQNIVKIPVVYVPIDFREYSQ